MINMAITQADIDLMKSRNKQVQIKVSLLDEQYGEVENLSGRIKAISYDISAESDIRRTCSLTLLVSKDKINTDFEKAWINRMVELHCGVYSRTQKVYVWYSLGRMLMINGNTTYAATTQEVKLSLVDMMATLTGDRGSQMGTDMLIPYNSNIHDAIVAIVATFSPYTRNNVAQFEDVVPYDLTTNLGSYPYDALKQILDLFPYYEMFYDNNGIFTVQMIPTKTSDPVDIGTSVIDDLLISENRSVNFSDVKNTTEIWGKTLDAAYTSTNTVNEQVNIAAEGETANNVQCYTLTIDSYENMTVNDTFSFIPPNDNVANQYIRINSLAACPLYNENGAEERTSITASEMKADIPYVVKYVDDKFVLQGEAIIHVIVQEIDQMPSAKMQSDYKSENNCRDVQWIVNPDSPFACTLNSTGTMIKREIKQVLSGGEYDNIYTTQLAYERASYENWLKTRLQDTVDLEMVLIPWMDVNDKIQYTSPTLGTVQTVLVQSISYDFMRWTMSVKCVKFYPYYPFWENA